MKRKILFSILFLFLILAPKSFAETQRIGGNDRYETATLISQSKFESNDYVVLVTGENYPDALCAAPFAKVINAPILLTTKNSLNYFTKQELIRLKVKKVYIIGGTGVISSQIELDLKNLGISFSRIFGSDRYATSIEIAKELNKIKPYSEVFLASGENYPDALSAASIAAKKDSPILLTQTKKLPLNVEQYIKTKTIQKTYVIGSIYAVYGEVANKMPNPIRIGGLNRFETNTKLIQYFKDNLDFNSIYISIGQGPTNKEYADALTGAVAAAIDNTAILLTKKDIVDEVKLFVKYNLYNTTKIIVLGGSGAVSLEQEKTLNEMVKSIPNIDKWKEIKTVMGFNKYELIDIKLRLEKCTTKAKTSREKEMFIYASNVIVKILDDPEYDYSKDVENMKSLKANLTQSEKDDILNIILDNFIDLDLSKLYNLKTSLGI